MGNSSPGKKSATRRQSKLQPSAKATTRQKKQRAEQKEASAQAPQDSELRYRRLFEAAQDGILILDARTGVIEDVNPYLIKMLGHSRTEFLKKKLWLVGAFKDINASKDALKVLQKKGHTRCDNLSLRAKDGHLIHVEFVTTSYPIGSHNVIQYNFRDITPRVQAEKEIQLQDRRFRAFIKNATESFTLLDTQGNVMLDSPAIAGMFGYDLGEWIGKKGFETIHPDDLQKVLDLFQHLTNAPGTRVDGKLRVRHKNGSWIWVEGIATNLLAEPAVNAIVLNYRDITDRTAAEEALRASEARFRGLFEDSPISLWEEDFSAVKQRLDVLRKAGITDFRSYFASHPEAVTECAAFVKILNVNKATMRLFGTTRKEDLLLNLAELFDGVPPPEFRDQLLAIAAGKTRFTRETVNKTLVGRSINAELDWSVAPGFENSLSRVIVALIDITGRKHADKRNQRQLDRLAALHDIDQAVSSSFDLHMTLTEILKHVKKQLCVDAADVLLLNSTSLTLEYSAGLGFRTKAIEKASVRLGQEHAGVVAVERQLVHIPNIKDQPPESWLNTHLAGEGFTCYCGVPLIVKGVVKGVLEVYRRTPLRPDQEWLDFLYTLAGQAALVIDNAQLFEDLQRSNIDLTLAYDATIEGWSRAMDLRDKETEGHTQRVTETTMNLAALFGIRDEDLVNIRRGALLHDMGKMGVPDGILLKEGPLTDEEWIIMRRHPTLAFEMLSPIQYLQSAMDIPYCHHEKWDGTGYPRGLKGLEIPLAARIFAIVDVWDALTSDRPYRAAWSNEKAIEYITSQAGIHFDPELVNLCLGSGVFDPKN